jgi:hypothetical protein
VRQQAALAASSPAAELPPAAPVAAAGRPLEGFAPLVRLRERSEAETRGRT